MPVIYNKEEESAVDTVSGASLSVFQRRHAKYRENDAYLFETGEETFMLSVFSKIRFAKGDTWSKPPIKSTLFIRDMSRIINSRSGSLQDIEAFDYRIYKFDYRPYKSVIETLLYVLHTRGDPEWPTETVIDFSDVDAFQKKVRVIQ